MDKSKYPQLKAIELRKKGLSYGEIKKEVNVSKSTLSLWLKTVPLTAEQRERLYTKKILNLARGAQSQRERRKREIGKILREAEKEVQLPLSFETYRLLGAFLYWAEGSKTTFFSVTNSDPHFILFIVRWFEKVFGIHPQNLKAQLNIYPQQNELEIKQFWSQLTGIPIENFGKSFIKPLNKNYKKNNLYYGTIRIKVLKGTNLCYRVFGWIKAILKDIAPDVELTQKEWKSLKEVPRPVNVPEDIKT
jgi:transposase-like protein